MQDSRDEIVKKPSGTGNASQSVPRPNATRNAKVKVPRQPRSIPKHIGRFEIHRWVGSGGFADVYQAYDPVMDRKVALKVPLASALETPERIARFLSEPKAFAALRHPNIVPLHDAGTADDHYYIAEAYIDGQTLKGLIEKESPDFRRSAESDCKTLESK